MHSFILFWIVVKIWWLLKGVSSDWSRVDNPNPWVGEVSMREFFYWYETCAESCKGAKSEMISISLLLVYFLLLLTLRLFRVKTHVRRDVCQLPGAPFFSEPGTHIPVACCGMLWLPREKRWCACGWYSCNNAIHFQYPANTFENTYYSMTISV